MSLLLRRTTVTSSKSRRAIRRCFSTSEHTGEPNKKQPNLFDKPRLEPGEWDHHMTDPLYRPKWRGDVRILSKDDFENQPGVSFSCEFENMFEAQATPSWMTQQEMDEIYDLYISLMEAAEKNNSVTSHEHVMRVLGQKFSITSWRAAAVITLKHNEEQMKRHEPHNLLEDWARRRDEELTFEVNDTYALYKTKPPGRFVEDVSSLSSFNKPNILRETEDVLDIDELERNADLAEEKKARKILDGHVYKIDQDDADIVSPMDKNCRQILNHKPKIDTTIVERQRQKGQAIEPVWPQKQKGSKKQHWSFVAQVIDTKHNKISYKTNDPTNTIVAHPDGKVSAGTMQDIQDMSWKPQRNDLMHCYDIVKRAWLDRVNRHLPHAWGRYSDYDPNIDYRARKEEADAKKRKQGSGEEDGEAEEQDNDDAEDDDNVDSAAAKTSESSSSDDDAKK